MSSWILTLTKQYRLAPLTYELGKEKHTFHFLNGPIPNAKAFPGLESFPGPYYRYYDRKQIDMSKLPDVFANPPPEVKNAEDWTRQFRTTGLEYDRTLSAREYVQDFVENDEQGPFDGIIGFSEGALVAADVILEQARTKPPYPIKCAIFFCGAPPWDYDNHRYLLADESEERICIPTLSVIGKKDVIAEAARALYKVCDEDKAILMEHQGGHVVPRDMASQKEMSQKIRRAINKARMS